MANTNNIVVAILAGSSINRAAMVVNEETLGEQWNNLLRGAEVPVEYENGIPSKWIKRDSCLRSDKTCFNKIWDNTNNTYRFFYM